MAFNFIPKSADEIIKSNMKTAHELAALWTHINNKFKGEKTPLALDKTKPTEAKVARQFSFSFKLKDLQKITPSVKLTFGNGSRGGGGAANKGLGFEREMVQDLLELRNEGVTSKKFKNKDFVKFMCKELGLDESPFEVDGDVGALNQRRPLVFQGRNIYIGSNNFKIGEKVTDVTIYIEGEPFYLSAKYGGTVTFFNAGVATIFTPAEMKAGLVKNPNGVSLLKMLGIDNAKFCASFNQYDPANKVKSKGTGGTVNVTNKVDRGVLQEFLKSGIGYGFILVHKEGSKVNSTFMTKQVLDQASIVQSVHVKYPEPGAAKRVDVFVETPMFSLKINIRNKQGGLYPSHIMSDYKHKH
jgi:hypothetical protein